MENKKYVAYYRISKDSHEAGKSKSKGLGLESQRNIAEYYYKDSIVKDFTETKSAKNIKDRPILQEAINYCLKNDCWLVVAKLDRLSRNTIDALSIIKLLNKRVSFCDIPSDGETDEFIITIFAAIAQRERELISIRTSQALQIKKKREGSWNKGNPKFKTGEIQSLAIAAIKRKADFNENNIRASEIILDKRKAGMTYGAIAGLLNQKKFVTAEGFQFREMQVKRIFGKYSNSTSLLTGV